MDQLHISGALLATAGRAKRENGGLGEDPPGWPMTHTSRSLGHVQTPIDQLHSSDGALLATAGRAKRENGGLGEDPPGWPMTAIARLNTLPWSTSMDLLHKDAQFVWLRAQRSYM
jgi:hypothetical protein